MSAVVGVNATKAADPSPANILAPGTFGGKMRVMYDYYEASSLAQGSTIKMGQKLPKGAIIVGMVLITDALGSSVTGSVGDSDTAARYFSAIDLNSTKYADTSAMVVDGLGYTVGTATGDDQILITTAGGSATGTIRLVIKYTTG